MLCDGKRSASKVAMQTRAGAHTPLSAFHCAILMLLTLPRATWVRAEPDYGRDGQLFWNVIGAVRRVRDARRGSVPHEADGAIDTRRAAQLLRDPDFLYETFYRSVVVSLLALVAHCARS